MGWIVREVEKPQRDFTWLIFTLKIVNHVLPSSIQNCQQSFLNWFLTLPEAWVVSSGLHHTHAYNLPISISGDCNQRGIPYDVHHVGSTSVLEHPSRALLGGASIMSEILSPYTFNVVPNHSGVNFQNQTLKYKIILHLIFTHFSLFFFFLFLLISNSSLGFGKQYSLSLIGFKPH